MDKVDAAIMRLREAAQMSEQIYGKPLVVTTSGGKDSSVCVALAAQWLARKAGKKGFCAIQNSRTTTSWRSTG